MAPLNTDDLQRIDDIVGRNLLTITSDIGEMRGDIRANTASIGQMVIEIRGLTAQLGGESKERIKEFNRLENDFMALRMTVDNFGKLIVAAIALGSLVIGAAVYF